MKWKIVDKNDNVVKIGDKIKSFRDEEYVLESIQPPTHSGSSGRVHVANKEGIKHSYYPSVFNLAIKPDITTEEIVMYVESYIEENFGIDQHEYWEVIKMLKARADI